MSNYYYLEDSESDSGYAPVLDDDMFEAILSIAKRHGLKITDKMIFEELYGGKKPRIKTSKKKTYLYLDGTNLFAGQNELFGPNKYLSFSYLVKEINKLIDIDNIFFYASYIGQRNRGRLTKRRKQLIAAEALFYREVKNFKGLSFYKGHRSPTSGKEKGVDVHLSVDIVKDVLLEKCDQIVIMTGDADLIYPLEIVKMFKIPTCAIFLPNRFSLEMAYKVDKAFVLNFLNRFKKERKLPKGLKVVPIKKPRMVNIRGR